MHELRKRPLAERDLREIWRYTFKHWGERRADDYLRRLNSAIQALARNPALGSDCGDILPGLRRRPIERHRIFYRVDAEMIVVIRVLHDRMDFIRHLGESDAS